MTAREILAQIWYRVSGTERRYLIREYKKELRARIVAETRLGYAKEQLERLDGMFRESLYGKAAWVCSVTLGNLQDPYGVHVPNEHGLLVEPKPVSRPQPRVSPSVPR